MTNRALSLKDPKRALSSCWVIGLILMAGTMAQAADAVRKIFDLPADAAEKSLRRFSAQSGIQVIFPTEVARGVRTRAVVGEFTSREALERMLANTRLKVVPDEKTGALTITRVPDEAPPLPVNEPKSTTTTEPTTTMKRKNPITMLGAWIALALTPGAHGAESGNVLAGQETGRIEGRVENMLTGVFLSNARVTVEGTKLETLTSPQGEYRLSGVAPGSARLRVFYTGLEERTINVTVRANETVQQDISLVSRGRDVSESAATQLDPFIVAAEREKNAQEMAVNERRFAPNVKNVVSGDQFGDVSDGNVGEFLKFLPGVTVGYSAWDPNTVSLRGMPSSTTVMTLDGAPISSVSSGNDRTMSLFGLSMNNVSRVEVTKSPTPDLPANALGGAVNLIPASAFDRRTPQTTYRAYGNFNTRHATFSDVPAPDAHLTMMGIQPGFDFKSIVPVNQSFGFTLTGLYTRRYDQLNTSNPNWVGVSSAGAGITPQNPYLGSYAQTLAAALWTRSVGSASVDWKFRPQDVLSLSLQYSLADTYHSTPSFTANPGVPESYGPTFVQGRVTAQPWSSYLWTRQIYLRTFFGKLSYRHDGPVWQLLAGVSYSKGSYSNDPSTADGVGRATFRLRNVGVRYDDITNSIPRNITARTAAGLTINPYDQNNLTIESVQNQHVSTSDLNWYVYTHASRSLNTAIPIKIKVGTDIKVRKKDRRAPTDLWTFVGPDGAVNGTDDLATNYDVMSESNYTDLPYGMPSVARWVDLGKMSALFKAHPEYFRFNEVNSITTGAASSKITETISSGYVRTDVRLIDNRLWLVGGVRYERTEDDGEGILNDIRATYQQDANGNLILGANDRPVLISTDPVVTARLRYQDRAARAKRHYGDFYPSLNASYTITPKFIARTAYARTIGRPNYSEITPGTTVSDPASTAVKTIGINNTGLKPWSAHSYDLSLEYYPSNGTILSVGGFYKEISDFFGGTSLPATPALLAELGLGDEYLDYSVNTKQNVGSARISGVEAEARFIVPFLPSWAKGLQVYGNGTAQSLRGADVADFSEYMSRSASWGFSFTRPRFSVMLNWNFQGRIKGLILTGVEPGSYRYTAPKTFADLNVEYRLNKRIAFYAVIKNLSNTVSYGQRYGPNAAPYARTFSAGEYGRQMTVGVKGSF